jgi:hypothetical protein
MQVEYLKKIQEEKARAESKPQITKYDFDLSHISACNKAGIIIYYEALNNYQGKIVMIKNGQRFEGKQVYKDYSQRIFKGDLKYWKVIEQLYSQEFFRLPEQMKAKQCALVDLEIFITQLNKGNL